MVPGEKNLISRCQSCRGLDKPRIKALLRELIILHDLGKLHPDFQTKLADTDNNASHNDKSYFHLVYKLLLFKKTPA
jgi:CRISPR/Cas system-associated endonuclease Cas3-HD